MEGKSSGNTGGIQGKSCGFQKYQESCDFMVSSNPQAQDAFPIRNKTGQKSDAAVPFIDFCGKSEVTKNHCDEDGCYASEEHVDGTNENEKDKKESPWHRVKWTDQMVKLLITACSYIGEEASSDCGRKVSPLLPKKGKWKAISKVMAERRFHVSPQQCEDKFNGLNKRYKKLNDMIGRGTCCEVVENPALLDVMDLSGKAKESARKILNSKQLFYQEMCSYHNGNRLHIPHDHGVQRSLQLALRSGDDLELHEEEEERDASDSLNNNTEDKLPKRKKPREDDYLDSDCILKFQSASKKLALYDHARKGKENDWFVPRSLELEEQRLDIETEMLELENQRLRWLKFSELEDQDLEKMRLENEHLKLENERVALEIKRREMGCCDN